MTSSAQPKPCNRLPGGLLCVSDALTRQEVTSPCHQFLTAVSKTCFFTLDSFACACFRPLTFLTLTAQLLRVADDDHASRSPERTEVKRSLVTLHMSLCSEKNNGVALVLILPFCRCDVCVCSQDDGRKTVSEQGVQRITSKETAQT